MVWFARPEENLVKMEDGTSKEFLETILRGMKAGLFAIDNDARIRVFTPQAESLTGYSKDEVLGQRCHEVFKTARCEECQVRKTQRVPAETLNYETTMTTHSGDALPADVSMSPLRSPDGETLGAVGIIRDMTTQKGLWDTLRRERDRARRYLSIARVTIVALDTGGRVTLINKRGCEILGHTEEEILGSDWFETCVQEGQRAEARRVFDQVIAGADEDTNSQELTIVTKDGAERAIVWHHVALPDRAGRIVGMLSSGEDITERMQAQAELIRSEKLAAIGQLAAGVAHEVNNPLAGILVYVKLLLKKYRANRLQTVDTEKQLLKIETELERSSRIIKDLLDFSRQSKPALRPVDVNEALESTLSIVGHQISLGNIRLEKNLASGLPRILADFDQIQQAMMNLILNAAQAMPAGGELTITTSHEKGVELPGSVRNAVRVAIADTGRGIPRENLDKVFAPFFSTKAKGKGVGLGLAAVQGIIERHKGKIEVSSEVNAGTTFTMWLGAADEETGENTDRGR